MTLHKYLYAHANPVKYTDTSGYYSASLGVEQEKVNEESGAENSDIPSELRDILDGAKPGRKTRGKSKQWEKSGNYDTAKEDYNKLNPENSKEISTQYGPGQAGTLSDGSKVNVRPGSSGGPPTLEVDLLSGKKVKIRYGE